MGVLEAVIEGHLSADRQHRIAFGGGGGQPGDQVGDAGARGGQTDADCSRQTPEGLGHKGGVLFMPAQHQLDRRVEQGNEHTVDLGAGDAEDMGDAVLLQQFHQGLSSIHAESAIWLFGSTWRRITLRSRHQIDQP